MTHSLILWIDLFVSPSSTTCLHTLAINLPSDVPPLVLISVFISAISSIESLHISINSWSVVRYGSPECFQVMSYFALLLSSIFIIVSLISSWSVSVEYLILNAILIFAGITLSTPVPLFILDIWKEVGGKYLLPLSNLISKNSEIILEL